MLIKVRSGKKKLLHVGCNELTKVNLPPVFHGEEWEEVRLDLDPSVKPDIVASITHMAPVANDSVDAIYCSHLLEHLFAHEVSTALAEFRRVLRLHGFALIFVPDLQFVFEFLRTHDLEAPIYTSSAGPVTGLDMIYGHRESIMGGNRFMAHHTGFTPGTLEKKLIEAGFRNVEVRAQERDVVGLAYKEL